MRRLPVFLFLLPDRNDRQGLSRPVNKKRALACSHLSRKKALYFGNTCSHLSGRGGVKRRRGDYLKMKLGLCLVNKKMPDNRPIGRYFRALAKLNFYEMRLVAYAFAREGFFDALDDFFDFFIVIVKDKVGCASDKIGKHAAAERDFAVRQSG